MNRTTRTLKHVLLGLGLTVGLAAGGPLACGDDDNGGGGDNTTPPAEDDAGMDGGDMMDTGEAEPDGGDMEPDGGDMEPDGGDMEPDGGETDPDGGDMMDGGTDATATLQLIHNSADPAASTVDVWTRASADADATLVVDDLNFRQATPRLEVPAGQDFNIALASGNSNDDDDGLADGELVDEWADQSFSADTATVAVVNGVVNPDNFEGDNGLTLATKADVNTSSQAEGEAAQVFAVHGATDAPAVSLAPGRQLGDSNLVDGLSFGSASDGYAPLEGQTVLDVGTAADGNFVTNLQTPSSFNSSFDAGGDFSNATGVYAVVASGFLTPGGDDQTDGSDGASLEFLVFPVSGQTVAGGDFPVSSFTDGVPLPGAARVQLVHATAADAFSEVNVTLGSGNDSETLASGLSFRDGTGFVSVPTDSDLPIEITSTNDNSNTLNPTLNVPSTGDGSIATQGAIVRGQGSNAGVNTFDARESRAGAPAAPQGSNSNPQLAFNAFHAATGAPDPVDVSVVDTSSGTELVGPASLAYDSGLGVNTVPATSAVVSNGVVRIAVPGGGDQFNFALGALSNVQNLGGTFATFVATDADGAPAQVFAVTEGGTSADLDLQTPGN